MTKYRGAKSSINSGFLMINTVLCSMLFALLIVLAADPSLAHYQGRSSTVVYRNSNGTVTDAYMTWNGSPPDFVDARNFALNQWRALGAVRIYRSSGPNVYFQQYNRSTGNNTVGYWQPYWYRSDTITFYRYNIRRFGYNRCDKRWTGVHEVGHALGFAHSDSNMGPSDSVMYSFHRAGWNVCSYRWHDKRDYRRRYGY